MDKQKEDQFNSEYDAEFARDQDLPDEELTAEQKRLRDYMSLTSDLVGELAEAITDKRKEVEGRLIAAARSYKGSESGDTTKTLEQEFTSQKVGSRVYHNITRQITNDGASQLGDLLFPSDDKNYGLNPVPLTPPPMAAAQEPAVDSKGNPLTDAEGTQLTNTQAHTRRMEKAAAKTKRMFTKLDSSLIAAKYPKKARRCIGDAAMYGTGILKGPIPNKAPSSWAKKKSGKYALRASDSLNPDVRIVSPLDFFPDMSASSPDEWGYTWERCYMLPSKLQALAKERGFDKVAVRQLMSRGPGNALSTSDEARNEVQDSSYTNSLSKSRFELWERHGDVSREKLIAAGVEGLPVQRWIRCVVYMVEGQILKVVVSPYESLDSIYSVFNWDEDPLCIFGYGIPYLMDNPQHVYNTAWRMCLDNAGVSTLPQIVVDKRVLKPADGSNNYSIYAGKVWEKTGELYSKEGTDKPFELFHISQDIQQLFALMDKAESDAYELTGVTRVEKSQQVNDNAPVTLGATQIMQNNSSVSRRSQARRYDDQITATLIQRFYDFFMQFEEDEDLKGRMEVEPRGSTILLSKELQASNLLQFYQLTGSGQAEGVKGLRLLRAISTSMQHPEGQFLKTDAEMEAEAEAQAQQGKAEDPALIIEERKAKAEERRADVDEAKIELEQAKLQILAEDTANRFQLDVEKTGKELELKYAKLEQDERKALGQSEKDFATLDVSLQKTSLTEKTKRDSIVAKLQSDSIRDEDAGTKTAVELSLRQQAEDRQDRELEHKVTTGQPGI